MAPRVLFRPPSGWVGDVIPYYWDGWYWLYYLHDLRSGKADAGTAWHLVRTRDFVQFDYQGEVLPSGGVEADDLHCYTGSIVEHGGVHHLFYTAYNPGLANPEAGCAVQIVRHATSADLLNWTKLEDKVEAPRGLFDPRDWRDPFVYHDEAGKFTMLVATRTTSGPARRRGVIARASSTDLTTWRFEEPLFGGRFYMHECPDLFKKGDWWYLIFSEFSDGFVTRYRMAETLSGPWQSAGEDRVDCRAYYAAKTAGDGRRRFAFGWVPTKDGGQDLGHWQWGGDLLVHELSQRSDGGLDSTMPEPLRRSFNRSVAIPKPAAIAGEWEFQEDKWRASAADSYAEASFGELPDDCLVGISISFEEGAQECGLVIRGAEDGPAGYYVRLDPLRRRLVLDQWPRPGLGELPWEIGGDKPYAIETERSVELGSDQLHRLEVMVSGSIGVAYLDRTVAMTFRMYDRAQGYLGLFVSEGSATFSDVSLTSR